jgi:type IV secretion system protein VirB6
VPLERLFEPFAAGLDDTLVSGMGDVVQSGLAWAAPQLRALLVLYVVAYALGFMLTANVSAREAGYAGLRGLMTAAAVKAANYVPWVQNLFFTTLPNQIATALNGPRTPISSAQQFDKLVAAVMKVNGSILERASHWTDVMDRGVSWAIAGLCLLALLVMFVMWLIPRVLMALVICIGPFLIPLYLFGGTRGFVHSWIGKLVGLTVLQLSSSVLLRILLVLINARFRVMQDTLGNDTDLMIANFFGIALLLWIGALLMFVLPSGIAIGASMGASQAAAGAVLLTAPGRAAGALGGGAARSAARGIARLRGA